MGLETEAPLGVPPFCKMAVLHRCGSQFVSVELRIYQVSGCG